MIEFEMRLFHVNMIEFGFAFAFNGKEPTEV